MPDHLRGRSLPWPGPSGIPEPARESNGHGSEGTTERPESLWGDAPEGSNSYGQRVTLEGRIAEAQAGLEALLASRAEATRVRTETQEVLEQWEAVQNEAQRVRDWARRALDILIAANPRDFSARDAIVRELDETRKSEAILQQAAQREASVDADRARIRVSAELLKTLNAVSTATAWVERELDEANNLSSVTDSLMESAQKELARARAVLRELFLDGREAQELLDLARSPDVAEEDEVTPEDDGVLGPPESWEATDSVGDDEMPIDGFDVQAQTQAPPAPTSNGHAPAGKHEPQDASENPSLEVPEQNGKSPKGATHRTKSPNGRKGRAQSLVERSSEVVKGVAYMGFQRAPSFSEEWDKLATGPIRGPESYRRKPPGASVTAVPRQGRQGVATPLATRPIGPLHRPAKRH